MINDFKSFGILVGVAFVVYLLGYLFFIGVAAIVRRATGTTTDLVKKRLGSAFRFLIAVIALNIANHYTSFSRFDDVIISKMIYLLLIAAISLVLIKISEFARDILYERFDVNQANNLGHRKVRTQIDFLQKMISVFIFFIAVAIALMSFDRVREMGASLIASAGIASVIIGFAAQKSIANLLAGFQIAFTQPLRLDDVLIVEGEWGRVEEITLTYVVINIWDSRRLIVPIGYFLEKPFQNWTRKSAELLGVVFIYVDYAMPVDFIRGEVNRILEQPAAQKVWDKRVAVVQVTDITDKAMQVRILVSAANSGNAFELRCIIREGLLASIHKHYPGALPVFRLANDGAVPAGQPGEDGKVFRI